MSGKQKWINISGKTIFMEVDGQVQRVRPDQTVTGSIADDLKCDFRQVCESESINPVADQEEPEVMTVEEERAEIKKWLDDHGVSYQPNTGVRKLRKYKAEKESTLGE